MSTTSTEIRESDSKGRITLPRGFANATLLLEQVSDVEVIIRKAKLVPLQPGQQADSDLGVIRLTADEFDSFVAALDNPPAPNDRLRQLLSNPPTG